MPAAEFLGWSASEHGKLFDMLEQAARRPKVFLDGDYTIPAYMPVPNFVRVRMVTHIRVTRAASRILLNDPDGALEEIRRINDLRRIMESEPPPLVSVMIDVAVVNAQFKIIEEGFAMGIWKEAHCRELGQLAAKIDVLPRIPESMRKGERASICHLMETTPLSQMHTIFNPAGNGSRADNLYFTLMPRGWMDQNIALYAELMQSLIEVFDAKRPYFNPRAAQETSNTLMERIERKTPMTMLARIAVPNYAKATESALRTQALANHAAIAAALELYRFQHGTYPESVEALASKFIEKLPVDVVTGKPVRYARRDNGEYALYSRGWDVTDDLSAALAQSSALMKSIFISAPAEKDWVWRGVPDGAAIAGQRRAQK